MSIIFKTLEKLKNDTPQKGAEQQKTRKINNVISFDKIASSLPQLLLVGFLVIAFGAAAYYVIKDLANNASGNDNEIVRSESIPESSETELPENEESLKNPNEYTREKIAAPGEAPPAQETVQANYLPPKGQANNKPNKTEPLNPDTGKSVPDSTRIKAPASGEISTAPKTVNADYSPPTGKENKNLDYQKGVKTQAQYSGPASTQVAGMSKQGMDLPQTSQKDSEQLNLLADNETVKQQMQEGISTALISKPLRTVVPAGNVPKPVYYESPPSAKTVAIHKTAANHNFSVRQSGAPESPAKYYRRASLESSDHEASEKMQEEKVHLASVKKNARICRLISKTKVSLFSGNDSRTESLLNELNSYKGQDDEYVMKLRAFWYLKRGKYELAKPLLDLLLEKDENDLEAGINMAVLEIRTNRLGQAQTRLENLRRIYADNTQIPSLLRKIKK